MEYRVHISTIMEADVIVEAEDEQEAYDMVDGDINAVDYCNETCGFESCDFTIEEVTCGGAYIEIGDISEY